MNLPQPTDQLQRPRTGYFIAPDAVFDRQRHLSKKSRLAAYEIAVWLALWRHSNRELQSFPSHDTLAIECGMGIRRVQIALRRLMREGHLLAKSGKASGRANVYTLVVPPQVHTRQRGEGRHGVRTPPHGVRTGSALRAHEGSTGKGAHIRTNQGRGIVFTPLTEKMLDQMMPKLGLHSADDRAHWGRVFDELAEGVVVNACEEFMLASNRGGVRNPVPYLMKILARHTAGSKSTARTR